MSSLYSARWYRVADLRPGLAPGLLLRRQRLRGAVWVQLSDPTSGRSVRLNRAAYALVGRLDGQATVQQAWDAQLQRPFDAATQDETIELLAQLREAGLLRLAQAADFDTLLPHLGRLARPAGRHNLLAWRLPLGNPDAVLRRFDPLARWLFCRSAFVLWLLALASLLWQGAQQASTLWAHGQTWLGEPRFALLAAALFLPVKLLHELAHGLAVRRWGGSVRQAGVTLMLGLPMPYVDASAASAFAHRHQRVLVSAAGMMAELALAALALALWLVLAPGLARDAAFALLLLTSVSTLVFNANPLLRLDGYYIASDLLQLPNLAPRSQAWWRRQLQRHLLRLPDSEPLPVARGEAPWLALYAPLAWANGGLVAALAVAWLGQLSWPLGLAAAVLLGWQMGLRPLWRVLSQLHSQAVAQYGSARRWRRLRMAGAAGLVLLLGLPLPQRSLVQGVVWPPDDAQLRADTEGQVQAVLVADGQAVQAGTVVLRLSNPQLHTEQQRQALQVAALEASLYNALPGVGHSGGIASGSNAGNRSGDGHGSGNRAGDARAQLAAAQAALARLDQRLAALAVRARVDGRLVLPNAADLPGRHLRRGTLVGQVITPSPPTVRVALPEADAADLRQRAGSATVWFSATPGQVQPARWLRDSGGAGLRLPSAALSQRHGGQIATDPKDKDDLTPLQPVLLLDLLLERPLPAAGPRLAAAAATPIATPSAATTPAATTPAATTPVATTPVATTLAAATSAASTSAATTRLGERVWVRFDAGLAPLAWQLARQARRVLLQRFNPQV